MPKRSVPGLFQRPNSRFESAKIIDFTDPKRVSAGQFRYFFVPQPVPRMSSTPSSTTSSATSASPSSLPDSLQRALLAARVAEENRGTDVVVLDLREVTPNFDFFVIASGTSRRQLHAISEEIDNVFEKQLGDRRLSIAGYQESRWIVLDYGDILIHLFDPEKRRFYALEELWGMGKRVECPQTRAEDVIS